MRYLILLLVILTASLGCSGSSGDMASAPDVQTPSKSATVSSHYTWGLWQFTADPAAETLDAVQLRSGNFHLNALPFLEPPPLLYLTLETLQFNGNIIDADIGLRHPFLGLNEFTGFDVCGIFISNGSVSGFDDASAGNGRRRGYAPLESRRLLAMVESGRVPARTRTMFGYKRRPARHAGFLRGFQLHV